MQAPRDIFIGDIQGCFDEWMALLEKISYQKGTDRLFLTGDVINRGPKSHLVLDYLIDHPEIRSVMGNHEFYFLSCCESEGDFSEGSSFFSLKKQLEGAKWEGYLGYLASLPLFIEDESWLMVHGGLEPGVHPVDSDPEVTCTLRTISLPEGDVPWYEVYEGTKFVVFGHWAKKGLVSQGNVRGLDTGCVYGRKLSALILPEDRVVSVKAQKSYYSHATHSTTW